MMRSPARLARERCFWRSVFCRYAIILRTGEVPEWLNGAVSKTVVDLVSTVGSNPTLSAERKVLWAYRLSIC